MAATLLGFELLSTLNEGDERITLSEILAYRDGGLTDLELWAVCRECCLALKSVHNSLDMFQTLCITPESLAFDASGSVCFLDLGSDPEHLYVPPEYETLGNSYKAHMFSLGMTMLYGAEYSSDPSATRHLGATINTMILEMTSDDYDSRLKLEDVMQRCQDNLDGCSVTSERICQELVAVARLETSAEDDVFSEARSMNTPLDMLQEMWLASNDHNSNHFLWPSDKSPSPDTPSLENQTFQSQTPSPGQSPVFNTDEIVSSSPHFGIITPPDLYRSNGSRSRSRSPIDSLEMPDDHQVSNNGNHGVDAELSNHSDSTTFVNHVDDAKFGNQGDDPDMTALIHTRGLDAKSGSTYNHPETLSTVQPIQSPHAHLHSPGDISIDESNYQHAKQFNLPPPHPIAKDKQTSADEHLSHAETVPCELVPDFDQSQKQDSTVDKFVCQESGVGGNVLDGGQSLHSDMSDDSLSVLVHDNQMSADLSDYVEMTQSKDDIRQDARYVESAGSQCQHTGVDAGLFKGCVLQDGVMTSEEPARPECPSRVSPQSVSHNNESVGVLPTASSAVHQSDHKQYTSVDDLDTQNVIQYSDGDVLCPTQISANLTESIPQITLDTQAVCMGTGSSSEGGSDQSESDDRTVSKPLTSSDTKHDSPGVSPGVSTMTSASVPPGDKTPPDIQDNVLMSGAKPRINVNRGPSRAEKTTTGQCVLDILEKLGAFHENELWSLCRECVLALLKHKHELPAYVSMETVVIEEDGHVTYGTFPEDLKLDAVYLAPELQTNGVVTDKTCLFGVAAMCWSAADYCLPSNQEPALSEEFENLLMSMTQDEVNDRPPVLDVLRVCSEYEKSHDISSAQICSTLYTDSCKAAEYGKGNALVRDVLSQEFEERALVVHAKLMENIREAAMKLKPASERQLPDLPPDTTLHHCLMTEIKHGHALRWVPGPKLFTVGDLYDHNPDYLPSLLLVTQKTSPSDINDNQSAFKAIKRLQPEGYASVDDSRKVLPNDSQKTRPQNSQNISPDESLKILPEDSLKFHPEDSRKVLTDDSEKVLLADHQTVLSHDVHKVLPEDALKIQTKDSQSATPQDSLTVLPEEFNSEATHFTPIVVHNRIRKIPAQKTVSRFASHKQIPNGKADEIVKNIKELKKNLLRMHRPRTLVQDLEMDVQREENGTAAAVTPKQELSSRMRHGQLSPSFVATQHSVSAETAEITESERSSSTKTVSPPDVLETNLGIDQGQVPSHSPGIQSMPLSLHPGILPFQYQLQQDPRTGLFQIVPVAISQNLAAMGGGGGHMVPPTSSPSNISPGIPMMGMPLQMPNGIMLSHPSPYGGSQGSEGSEKGEKKHRSKHRDGGKRRDSRHHHQNSESSDCEKCYPRGEHSCTHKTSSRSRNTNCRHNHSRTSDSDVSPRSVARSDSARYPSMEDGLDGRRHSNDGLSNYENLTDYEAIPSSSRPMRPRQVKAKDSRSKLKRAKSGSSLDYCRSGHSDPPMEIYKNSCDCGTSSSPSADRSKLLYKSQPDLNHNLVSMDERSTQRGRRRRPSPDLVPSPSLSPSWSKDSGVGGLNTKGSGDATLMEKLLNSETIRHQLQISQVIPLLREEFAYEGYMENGIEDVAMADYIISLANLRWDTFRNAITEKYSDLYWQDDLLRNLSEAVNGQKPNFSRSEKSDTPSTVKSDDGGTSCQDDNSNSAFKPVNFHNRTDDGAPDDTVRPQPQWASNEDRMLQSRDQSEGQLQWHNHRKHMERQRSLELESSGNGLLNATYLRNCSSDNASLKYSVTDIDIESSQSQETTSPLVSDRTPSVDSWAAISPQMASTMTNVTPLTTSNMRNVTPMTANSLTNVTPLTAYSITTEESPAADSMLTEMSPPTSTMETNNSSGAGFVVTKQSPAGTIVTEPTIGARPMAIESPAATNTMVTDPLSDSSSMATEPPPVAISMVTETSSDDSHMKTMNPRMIYVQSKLSDVAESVSDHLPDPFAVSHPDLSQEKISMAADVDFKSKSLHNLAMSDSTATSEYRIIRSGQGQRSSLQGQPISTLSVGNLLRHEACSQPGRQEESKRFSTSAIQAPPIRQRSVFSKSESNLISATDTDLDITLQGAFSDLCISGTSIRIRRSEVAYYHADVEQSRKEELSDYISQQESQCVEAIESRLHEIDQEMMMEHRNRRKTLKYFVRLAEVCQKGGKGNDQKPMLQKTTQELEKSQNRICFLDSARKYLEMVYCEQYGLEPELLYALAKCPGDRAMLLSPCTNPLVQFQGIRVGDGQMDSHILQAGTPLGLMAHLFAQTAVSEGYMHEFFYCYRYFVSPTDLLQYIINKYSAAILSLSPGSQVPLKVKSRSSDLLYIWLDGYYGMDFKNCPEMMQQLEEFMEHKVMPNDSCVTDLAFLLEECKDGRHVDLVFSSNTAKITSCEDKTLSSKNTHIPKKWESFKAALHLSAKPMKLQRVNRTSSVACIDRKTGIESCITDIPRTYPGTRRADSFSLTDYTPQVLAEQLTLMQQELFQKSHPVHYFNSKAQGIGVALTNPVLNKALLTNVLNTAWEDNRSSNLFVGFHHFDDAIPKLIEHAQNITFWVVAEIISCSSSKSQIAMLCQLMTTAKMCGEMRNFATCLAILEGLENVIVRQLPVWKNLPSKYTSLMDELSFLQGSLKSNSLHQGAAIGNTHCPTIPCVLLFLLHVQREEIGGFTLANSMYKWTKIRSLAKMVDQIRIYQQSMFDFEADISIQTSIRQHIQYLGEQDLGILATQQHASVQRTQNKKTQGVFKRMRQHFQR